MKSTRIKLVGFTLIEVQVALAVALVIVLGAVSFRFHSAKAGARAEVYNIAAQIGNHILKTWHNSGQLETFNPVTTLSGDDGSFIIKPFGSGLSVPTGMTLLGHYQIVSGENNCIATLAYQAATSTEPALRAVGVGWRENLQAGALDNSNNVIWLSMY